MGDRFQFCGYCGKPLGKHAPSFYICLACGKETYDNPLPVANGLIPVREPRMIPRSPTGLLVVQRNIEPQKGKWALPGGFMERGESWQQGLTRELFEETGLRFASNDVKFFDVASSESTQHTITLIFGETLWVEPNVIEQFQPNHEVSAVKAIYRPAELAFPTHSEAAWKFFERHAA